MRLKTKTFKTWVPMPDGSRWHVQDVDTPKMKEMERKNGGLNIGFSMDSALYQIIGWEGNTDEEKNPLEFSREALQSIVAQDLSAVMDVIAEFNRLKDDYVAGLRKSSLD